MTKRREILARSALAAMSAAAAIACGAPAAPPAAPGAAAASPAGPAAAPGGPAGGAAAAPAAPAVAPGGSAGAAAASSAGPAAAGPGALAATSAAGPRPSGAGGAGAGSGPGGAGAPSGAVAGADGTVLITLGTRGGPLPTPGRSQSASLLVVRGSLYLVDAGDNVARRIQESGHDFRAVDKVFLTHLHGDHTWGLAHLVGSAWQYHRKRPIDVYGSGVEPLVRGLIAYLTPNAEIWALTGKAPLTDVVRAHEIQPGVIYRDANVTVTAVENTHFHFKRESPAYGKYRSYSYRFDTPTRAIVFTGDTSTSDALTELARGADVLVTEVADPDAVVALLKQTGGWAKRTPAEQEGLVRHLTESHLSAVEVGRLAAKAGVGRVVMTHLVPTVDPADRYERYVTEARRHYAGPIAIAEDLMRF